MATLRGEKVDRPPVSFYETNGLTEDEKNPDPFNIYNDPSWKELLCLAREKTDRIVSCSVRFSDIKDSFSRQKKSNYYDENGSFHEITEINVGERIFRQHTRRDKDTNTIWILEHFIKDVEDLQVWIELQEEVCGEPDYTEIYRIEKELGDTGIVMIDIGDALCDVASMMDMEDYLVIAMTEQEIFHKALEKKHQLLKKRVEKISKDLPGRLWRIYGPEYAAPPYLPPYLYKEYVTDYDTELVKIIHQYGGIVRIHQHGKQKDILDYTVQTGCDGLDPIEPFPQGDVTLSYVKEKYGKQLILFGNLEFCDLEMLGQTEFEKKVVNALKEGMSGEGRGFVLMPSACPISRKISDNTLKNYKKIIEVIERL